MSKAAQHAIDAMRVVMRSASGAGGSSRRANTTWDQLGDNLWADVYWPKSTARAVIALIPGRVPGGERLSGLVQFAAALAEQGFTVVVPHVASARERCLTAGDAATIARTLRALLRRPEGAGQVGVAAISSAVCPTVLAVLEPDLASRVDFVIAVGGYVNSAAAITFFTTGCFRGAIAECWRVLKPDQLVKWSFMRANSDRLDDRRDQVLFDIIADCKHLDPHADVAQLHARLGAQGRSVLALIDNCDPERVPALIAALPSSVRQDLELLDLSNRTLRAVRARFHIIHYREDEVFPYTESIALAAALRPCQAELTLLEGPGHADIRPTSVANGYRLWRALYGVLSQRNLA